MHAAAFAQAQAAAACRCGQQPRRVEGERLKLSVQGLPEALRGQKLEVFPETPAVLIPAAVEGKDWTQAWEGNTWTASLPLSPERGKAPTQLPLVLAPAQPSAAQDSGSPQGWHTVAAIEGLGERHHRRVSPALAAALQANQAAAQPPGGAPAPAGGSFWFALLGGLLGGMLLNLMPCVFPVLAIKVMGFARHGNHRPAQRVGGLAYTAGVVLSFLALGGLLLALRAAGEQLGWGFQLQSPAVVALLAGLFTLIGLNLAGLFEFGQFLPSRVATLQARHPAADAFLTGVLAVAIASPCTAPFMGRRWVCRGPARTQALAVFGALGVGMALPYLLAAWCLRWRAGCRAPAPGWTRSVAPWPSPCLPRWCGWCGCWASKAASTAQARCWRCWWRAAAWCGRWAARAQPDGAGHGAAGLDRLAGGQYRAAHHPPCPGSGTGHGAGRCRRRLAALVGPAGAGPTAAGKPVFIDFTAAWCITCQYNKRNALADAQVLADFAAKGVTLLRADWTRRDPAITAALADLGRNGVPVYVLVAPGRTPVVMSEILSVSELRAALAML
jgi:thiol:disulfide interchange protein DsbD